MEVSAAQQRAEHCCSTANPEWPLKYIYCMWFGTVDCPPYIVHSDHILVLRETGIIVSIADVEIPSISSKYRCRHRSRLSELVHLDLIGE